jgi:UDP-N-acetylmuramyl pentapeptide phosphotransferase/UDP-N-acetylglucosamine-1-phosphate transferase
MRALGMFDITFLAGLASLLFSVAIVKTQSWHGRHSLDSDLAGIQKFHTSPVPRVGGIALVFSVFVASILLTSVYPVFGEHAHVLGGFTLLVAGMPAFLAGLVEDVTKRVSAKARLLATFASPLLACWMLDAHLPYIGLWGVDDLFRLLPFAILVTAFLVAGIANSINIIDGFHGMAGIAVVIILTAMSFLSWQTDDIYVLELALVGIGATLGFLLVNYPTGRLFLGDGGAYFLGFWIAEVAVLLVARNPEINPWQVLAIYAYPVIEVLFSIYRRAVIRRASPGAPDRLHLHTLLYRRVVCHRLRYDNDRPWVRNAAVAFFVGSGIALMAIIAVGFGSTPYAAVCVVIVETLLYMAVYTRLIRRHWCLNPAVALGLWHETRQPAASRSR